MSQRGIFEKVPGSGVWWICWFDQFGKRHREKAGTKSAAIALYRKRKTQALEGWKLPERLRRRSVGFSELVDDMLEYSRMKHRPLTYCNSQVRAEKLRVWFGNRPVDSTTTQEIERQLDQACRENDWRPGTVNRYRAMLSLIFRLAVENGKLSGNPTRKVKRLKENNERVRFLTEEEERRLRTAIHEACPEHLPEFELALHTGMRKSEQYGLAWENVNTPLRVLTVLRSKSGEARHIPLNTTALDALDALRKLHPDSPLVCGGGKAPFWFRRVLRRACVANFRWHDLRHTFASRLTMAGVPSRTVLELLGDKTPAMILRYAHLSFEHELEAVEKLAGMSGPQNEVPPELPPMAEPNSDEGR